MPIQIAPLLRRLGVVVALVLPLLLAVISDARGQHRSSSIIVRFRPGITVKSGSDVVRSMAAGLGLRATMRPLFAESEQERSLLRANRLDRYMVVESDPLRQEELLYALNRYPMVEAAFENHTYRLHAVPGDSLYREQWGLERVEAEGAWEVTQGDSTLLAGIIDTGVELGHPDLAGAFAINRSEDINVNGRFDPWAADERLDGVTGDIDGIDQDGNGYADDVVGYDFVDQTVQHIGDWNIRDAIPADELGHGTNVAGVIGARHNNIGVAGLAPGVRLVVLRAFDASGNGEDDDIASAIVYAADRGVKVLNLSFGDYYYSPLQRDAISYAHSKGVTIVASSGNEGGNSPHYPSSFPEVIAVGATTRADILSFFSTYGSQLSLTAPGSDIYTTDVNGRYKQASGTSFSAPYVAATAALLLSAHPTWSPDEVRSVLELTSDDRGRRGWDVNYGAGRLNARRALLAPGAASVAIQSPANDTGFGPDTVVTVIGSAVAPLLESWQLLIGKGDEPEEWTPLTEPQTAGKLRDRLGTIDPKALKLEGGLYTLRLLLRQTNGRETERRGRIHYALGKPLVQRLDTGNFWRFQERAYGVIARTNQLSSMTIWLRPAAGADEPYRPASLEPERTGVVHEHFLFLTSMEMARDLPYEAYIEFRGLSGDTTLIGSPADPLTITRSGDAFSPGTLEPLPYRLPHGFMLNEIAYPYGDNQPALALNRFQDATYGKLMIYSFNGTRFVERDSVDEQWIPRGFGDTDGNGLLELLVQGRGAGVIYEQGGTNGSLFGRIAYADTLSEDFWGSQLHDLDRDGRDEVIARSDNNKKDLPVYYIARRQGGALERIAELPNSTAPARGDARNKFGPPLSEVADFDGDGLPEILFGDDDADFLIYEREPDGTYRKVWQDENDGEGGSEYIAAGDLNGDGRAEAIVAYHTRTVEDFNREYAPPFWTVKVFTFDASGNATLMWQDRFAYVRPTLPYLLFSGISAGQLDRNAGDEIVLSLFPNLYVLTRDAETGGLKPFWYAEGSITNKPIIADFNRDGIAELGYGDGDLIRFYQIDTNILPLPPAGFKGWTLNDSTTYLEWNPVPGADYYTLYRGVMSPTTPAIRFDSVAVTTGGTLIDTGFRMQEGRLLRDRFYYYIVTARDTSLANDESPWSNAVLVFTHPSSRVLEAVPLDEKRLRVVMDFRVKDGLYEPGIFDIIPEEGGAPLEIATVATADRFSFLVTLRDEAAGKALTIRPARFYRDFYDSPADTSTSVRVVMGEPEIPGERFIATRATVLSSDRIAIDFNAPVDRATAENLANYVLSPGGEFSRAEVDPNDPRRVILTISGSYPIGPLGKVYTVTINNVLAADGRLINDGAGSVVGFTFSASDLADVFVYPHPFSISRDQRATFAGLTRSAEIKIFTQSGKHLRTLQGREGHGGLEWDGTDDNGRILPPGIYLYTVTGTTADGREVESELRKIAITP